MACQKMNEDVAYACNTESGRQIQASLATTKVLGGLLIIKFQNDNELTLSEKIQQFMEKEMENSLNWKQEQKECNEDGACKENVTGNSNHTELL